MSLQSNHFPESLDTTVEADALEAAGLPADFLPSMSDVVAAAIEELLITRFNLNFADAAAVANMTANCCETNLLKVLSDPADMTVATVDEEPAPF